MIDATVSSRPSSHTLNTPVVRRKQSRRHEQRIARQKEADEQSRLGEDDRGEADVAAPRDEGANVADAMKKVEQTRACSGWCGWERGGRGAMSKGSSTATPTGINRPR